MLEWTALTLWISISCKMKLIIISHSMDLRIKLNDTCITMLYQVHDCLSMTKPQWDKEHMPKCKSATSLSSCHSANFFTVWLSQRRKQCTEFHSGRSPYLVEGWPLGKHQIFFFFQLYWDTIDIKFGISLRRIMWWFDTYIMWNDYYHSRVNVNNPSPQIITI